MINEKLEEEKENRRKEVLGFNYKDVAQVVLKNRRKFNAMVVYFDVKAHELGFAGTKDEVRASPSFQRMFADELYKKITIPESAVKLFEWNHYDELAIPDYDLTLCGLNGVYDVDYEFYQYDQNHGVSNWKWNSFKEYLKHRHYTDNYCEDEYEDRYEIYLVRKMELQNMARDWASLIKAKEFDLKLEGGTR
jgi:hypothetical protein